MDYYEYQHFYYTKSGLKPTILRVKKKKPTGIRRGPKSSLLPRGIDRPTAIRIIEEYEVNKNLLSLAREFDTSRYKVKKVIDSRDDILADSC